MIRFVTVHNDEGLTAEVPEGALAIWAEHGWTVVDDESDEAELASADEAVPDSGPADPDDNEE